MEYAVLNLKLEPHNQQLGRVAMNCTVTEEQWQRIRAILMSTSSGPATQPADGDGAGS